MHIPPQDLYHIFWSKFKLVLRDHYVYPDQLPLCKPKDLGNNEYEICLEEPICLLSWPCRHSVTDKVHIIVDFVEKYRWDTTGIQVLSSVTTVYYCYHEVRASRKEILIESLNYEYHPNVGAEDGDPLLHTHIKNKLPEFEIPTILAKKLRHAPGQPVKFHSNTPHFLKGSRIPTIQMSLPDILCYLVADHIRDGVVRTIIERTGESLRDLSKYKRRSPAKMQPGFWESLFLQNWYEY